MPTNVAALKAKIQEELAIVEQEILLIDYPAEKALQDAAQAELAAAQATYDKKTERWTLTTEKVTRKADLEAQLALFNQPPP